MVFSEGYLLLMVLICLVSTAYQTSLSTKNTPQNCMFVFSHFCVIKLLIVNSLVAVELLRYMLHILIVSVTLGTCLVDKDEANDK